MSDENKIIGYAILENAAKVDWEKVHKYALGVNHDGYPRSLYDVVTDWAVPPAEVLKTCSKKKKSKKVPKSMDSNTYEFYLDMKDSKKKKKKKKKSKKKDKKKGKYQEWL